VSFVWDKERLLVRFFVFGLLGRGVIFKIPGGGSFSKNDPIFEAKGFWPRS
jgi:hypothetical protein